MRSPKFRHNYKKDYLAKRKGTYDYSKIYKIIDKHGNILDSGWYDTQIMGALHKAWVGYVISKIKVKMIRKFTMLQLSKNYKEN